MTLPVDPSRSLTAYNQNTKLDVVIEMSLADQLPVPYFEFHFQRAGGSGHHRASERQ